MNDKPRSVQIIAPDGNPIAPEAPEAQRTEHPAPAAEVNEDRIPSDVMGLLRQAAAVDWTEQDIDLPRSGFVSGVNVEILAASLNVRCACGTELMVDADGESRSRCHKCQRVFRHVVLLQDEDAMPSTIGLLLDEVFRSLGLKN